MLQPLCPKEVPPPDLLRERIELIKSEKLKQAAEAHAAASPPLTPVKLIRPGDGHVDSIGDAVECQEWRILTPPPATPTPKSYRLDPKRIIPPLKYSNLDLRDSKNTAIISDSAPGKVADLQIPDNCSSVPVPPHSYFSPIFQTWIQDARFVEQQGPEDRGLLGNEKKFYYC